MNKNLQKLPLSYYQSEDVVALSKDLIGKMLFTQIDGKLTGGYITETEAYSGRNDKACHAHLGRFTKRTQVMYEPGGLAYVYLIYGIHQMINFVTNVKGLADAILIRAIEPTEGIDIMMHRRNKIKLDKTLTSGPGNLTKALAIDKTLYGAKLNGDKIFVTEPLDKNWVNPNITISKRIGIDYAEEHADLPWRFHATESKFVSKR